jgi:ATP-dependent Lhr-like helicase
MFDTGMLTAEFLRAGAAPDDLLSLCTLELAQRHGRPGHSLRLPDCLSAEGLEPHDAHTAEADAEATVRLLRRYLARARQDGVRLLEEIGATGALPRPGWAPWPPGGRHQTRAATRASPATVPLPVPAQATASATVYADLIARGSASPGGLREQLGALRAMADRLNLDPPARQTVHASLAHAWRPYPAAVEELDRL